MIYGLIYWTTTLPNCNSMSLNRDMIYGETLWLGVGPCFSLFQWLTFWDYMDKASGRLERLVTSGRKFK